MSEDESAIPEPGSIVSLNPVDLDSAAATDGAPPVPGASAPLTAGDISMRRSPWKSTAAALAYVQMAARTDSTQIRTSDRVTIIALLVFCILEILSLVYTPLAGLRFPLMCCCDFVLGTCIVLFLVYRIGILSALTTRQALIGWQLMMGCIFLGIFLCLNAIFGIAYLVETFFPHPLM